MTGQIKTVRYNVMDISSVGGFMSVTGGYRNDCKDVYFLRIQGYSEEMLKEILAMDERLTERMNMGVGVYQRLSRLPVLLDPDEAGYYADCYMRWTEERRERLYTKNCTEALGALPYVLSDACRKVLAAYGSGFPLNASIEKNLIVKLLFWFDRVTDGWIARWDARTSVKIAADNITKKQEYFFFYLLTLVGCDVLLIQSRADIQPDIDKLGLSKKLALGAFDPAGTIPERAVLAEPNRIPEAEPCRTEPNRTPEAALCRTEPMRIPEAAPRRAEPKCSPVPAPCRTEPMRTPETNADVRVSQVQTGKRSAEPERREKSYEELAMLAASVVMIAVHDQKGTIVSTGSGIMIGKDGYILTNNHVASGGLFYSVKIEDDDRIYETREVVKYHSLLDLALIRIDRSLNPIPVYKGSKKLVRGQRVVAIGSPLGLFNTVSDGIVSGFRVINDVDMIQFTAPTSHGSSGGAVLNLYGEIIGISTAGIDQGQNLNLAVGYENINQFIRGFV